MRRLDAPVFDAWETTMHAASKFDGTPINDRIAAAEGSFRAHYELFAAASADAAWFELQRCAFGNPDQIIFDDFSKRELKELYEIGLVKGAENARDIYDQIKVAAEGRCPYCGGIGSVDPLDHYLPKARYPQFAVCPTNLVPCCDRCNKLSGSGGFDSYEEQAINPYFDDLRFFEQPWISVEFPESAIIPLRYLFDPPDDWSDRDKERAENHFKDFELAKRYVAAASPDVSYLGGSFVDRMRGLLSASQLRQLLSSKSNAIELDLNGWQRPLYRALADADWYLAQF
jgi:hypothetical protein